MAVLSIATIAIGLFPQPLWIVAEASARALMELGQ